MMRVLISISIILSLLGCAPAHIEVSEEFQPLVDEYFQIVGAVSQHSGSIVMSDSLPQGVSAQCDLSPVSGWKISVNIHNWKHHSLPDQKSIMFHELTHCIFQSLGHSPDVLSYMYSTANPALTDLELTTQVKNYIHSL